MVDESRRSEVWKGIGRGVGWAFGVGAVVTVASVLSDGGRATAKGLMKATMQARVVVAELSEQLQDLYAEATHEYQRPQGQQHG